MNLHWVAWGSVIEAVRTAQFVFGVRFLTPDCRLCVWRQVDLANYLAPPTEPAGCKSNSLLCAHAMDDNVGSAHAEQVTAVWGNEPSLASKLKSGISLFACMMECVE